MSNFKVKGVIKSIGQVKDLDNGAKVLDYVIEETSENGYKTLLNFNIYKKAEHATHVDNFIQYNKVGDEVEVEFTIRGREYQGKVYNDLSHWKIEKIGQSAPLEVEDNLPF
jgi:hypothetical protein